MMDNNFNFPNQSKLESQDLLWPITGDSLEKQYFELVLSISHPFSKFRVHKKFHSEDLANNQEENSSKNSEDIKSYGFENNTDLHNLLMNPFKTEESNQSTDKDFIEEGLKESQNLEAELDSTFNSLNSPQEEFDNLNEFEDEETSEIDSSSEEVSSFSHLMDMDVDTTAFEDIVSIVDSPEDSALEKIKDEGSPDMMSEMMNSEEGLLGDVDLVEQNFGQDESSLEPDMMNSEEGLLGDVDLVEKSFEQDEDSLEPDMMSEMMNSEEGLLGDVDLIEKSFEQDENSLESDMMSEMMNSEEGLLGDIDLVEQNFRQNENSLEPDMMSEMMNSEESLLDDVDLAEETFEQDENSLEPDIIPQMIRPEEDTLSDMDTQKSVEPEDDMIRLEKNTPNTSHFTTGINTALGITETQFDNKTTVENFDMLEEDIHIPDSQELEIQEKIKRLEELQSARDSETEGIFLNKRELLNLILYIDRLLKELPEEKALEFEKSKYQALYDRIFEAIGI